jgi:CubicO group peptidase (beta-lactamase class C family)
VPNGDKITIDELLTMRSGLYNYTDSPELAAIVDRDPTKVWTTEEVLAIAFARPPNFPPGTAYEYNNTNYMLLGLIAEQVDGRPLARAMQDRLFGPLGMHDTILPARTSNTIPNPYSHGYLYGSSLFVLTDTPYPPDIQAAARAGTLLPTDYTDLNPSFAYFPGASSPPPTISPSGSRHWLPGASSTPRISAAGSTACRPRTRACPTDSSTGTAWSDCAGARTRYIFTAVRPPATMRTWATTPTAR